MPIRCGQVRRFRQVSVLLPMLLAFVGCTAPRHDRSLHAGSSVQPWSYAGRDGFVVSSGNYLIHSTIPDRDVVENLALVMESALREYRRLTPGLRGSSRPMECYIFANRGEWAQFTLEKTGEDAAIYLKINRGGYTVRDRFVAYFIGAGDTYGVAAHEGWHQYVARHFQSRLPPFLEEGIATMFESIRWSGGRPYWTLGVHPARAEKLRRAIDNGSLWPLSELVTMHAGDVVNLGSERIETFYAQNWAFAQFLWDADDARHRRAMQRMLMDLATGGTPGFIRTRRTSSDLWDPDSAGPLLEHYLGMSFDEIERRYLDYVRRIARERRMISQAVSP